MDRKFTAYLVLLPAIAWMPLVALAASSFKAFTGLGTGDVSVDVMSCVMSCPDVTCPPKGVCVCIEAVAFPFKADGGIGSGALLIELQADSNTQTAVVAGVCENASGEALFASTNGKNTLLFGLAGRYCQTNPLDSTVASISGSFNIAPGTGTFAEAAGTGLFSLGGPVVNQVGTSPMEFQLTGSFGKRGTSLTLRSREGTDWPRPAIQQR
jgi:hypothetical protein